MWGVRAHADVLAGDPHCGRAFPSEGERTDTFHVCVGGPCCARKCMRMLVGQQ